MRNYDLLIGGGWVPTDERDDVHSPYSGKVVGRVARATARHAQQAVEAAARVLAEGGIEQHERAAVLERARALVLARRDVLATSIAEEAGKPLTAARAEADRCADTLLFAAVEARKLAGSVVPLPATPAGAGKLGFTLLGPKGVAAAITPFNFPLNLVCHKLAPAFAAGCPVVLKPAEETPLTAFALAEILLEAGLPPGYLSVLTGPPEEIGPAITSPPEVAVISFTGSTTVGRLLQERNPRKRVLLELGSNSPVLVDAGVDVAAVADTIVPAAFGYAGQSCISVQRVYVHQEVKEAFLRALTERVALLRVGDPLDPETDVGPLIREADRERVLSWIEEAVGQGAKLRAGGQVNPDGTLQPVILDDVTQHMRVSREEVFGPVVVLHPVRDLDQAILLANDSRYGLNAGVFTPDYATAVRSARTLDFGTVLVNEAPTYRADQMPYGGVRDSGNTREGPPYAIHDYLEEKLVILS